MWAGNTFESACHSCEISTSKMSRSGILRPLSRLASVATLVGILLYSRQEEATLIPDNRSDPNNIDEPDPHCRTLLLYTVSPFSLFACNPIKACCYLDPHPLKSPSPKMYPPIMYFPRKSNKDRKNSIIYSNVENDTKAAAKGCVAQRNSLRKSQRARLVRNSGARGEATTPGLTRHVLF